MFDLIPAAIPTWLALALLLATGALAYGLGRQHGGRITPRLIRQTWTRNRDAIFGTAATHPLPDVFTPVEAAARRARILDSAALHAAEAAMQTGQGVAAWDTDAECRAAIDAFWGQEGSATEETQS